MAYNNEGERERERERERGDSLRLEIDRVMHGLENHDTRRGPTQLRHKDGKGALGDGVVLVVQLHLLEQQCQHLATEGQERLPSFKQLGHTERHWSNIERLEVIEHKVELRSPTNRTVSVVSRTNARGAEQCDGTLRVRTLPTADGCAEVGQQACNSSADWLTSNK